MMIARNAGMSNARLRMAYAIWNLPPRAQLRYTSSQPGSLTVSIRGSSIDRIAEKIPKISWETINSTRAPVTGLFFPDIA